MAYITNMGVAKNLRSPRAGVRRALRWALAHDVDASVAELHRDVDDLRREVDNLGDVVEVLNRRHYGDMPVPPESLRLRVGLRDSVANFLAQGIRSSERVLQTFGERPSTPILDWGCGSGRTLRWLQCYVDWRTHYHGCDVDADAIAWLKDAGTFKVAVNQDMPPLPYPDHVFGGIFAFSVLTHIHPTKHRAWYEELRRVLQPGGKALLTTHGASIASESYGIPEDARSEFANQGYTYVRNEGHYKDAALASEGFTRTMLNGLFAIEYYEERGYQNLDSFLVRASAA